MHRQRLEPGLQAAPKIRRRRCSRKLKERRSSNPIDAVAVVDGRADKDCGKGGGDDEDNDDERKVTKRRRLRMQVKRKKCRG